MEELACKFRLEKIRISTKSDRRERIKRNREKAI